MAACVQMDQEDGVASPKKHKGLAPNASPLRRCRFPTLSCRSARLPQHTLHAILT
jgi:hypothetical protein